MLRFILMWLVAAWQVPSGIRRKPKPRKENRQWLGLERLEALLPIDNGGNSLEAATNLGTISGSRQLADCVGAADPNDYHRFRLAGRSNLRAELAGLTADADLEVMTTGGSVLARSNRGGSNSELINLTLEAGDYVVRVYRYSGNTNYRLALTASLIQPAVPNSTVPDNAGNSLRAARNLGVLSGTQTHGDFVGRADRADFYRFQLNSRSAVDVRVGRMSADAEVYLLDANGNPVMPSTRRRSAEESMQRSLDAGKYYLRVEPYGSAETNYRLTLSAVAEGPADGAGNSQGAARDLVAACLVALAGLVVAVMPRGRVEGDCILARSASEWGSRGRTSARGLDCATDCRPPKRIS